MESVKSRLKSKDKKFSEQRRKAKMFQVISRAKEKAESPTEAALLVKTTTDEEINNWNKFRIVQSLVKETQIKPLMAEKISDEIEKYLYRSGLKIVTTDIIRELINVKSIEYGLNGFRKYYSRLGIPIYDLEQILVKPNKENANIPHNPEATNLTISEILKKEYALQKVFSTEVTDAHLNGDIHLHDLGFIDRPYCSGQSLEYIKKFGLDLPNAMSIAKPAKHAEVLLAHMVKFSAVLQGHFAGAIGWDAVNLFYAPYLTGMPYRDLKQLAQMLIFEYSQQAVARGGQAIFSDINLYWEVPKHFEQVPAIGPGGEYTGKKYGEYEKEAQNFVKALFEVYLEGDGCGRPFFFPKPLVHMTEKFFKTPGYEEFLELISNVASQNGNTYFVFDRGETAKISECCRLSFNLNETDLNDAKNPWKMRFCAIQNVTLNLPRVGYIAKSEKDLMKILNSLVEIAVKAHIQKKNFISKLLQLGDNGTLAMLSKSRDGEAYLRLNRASYLIGILGLNDLVCALTGKELHESNEALKMGLKIIGFLNMKCKEMSNKYNMHFVLEQTPAESTAYRFAKLDMKYFKESAKNFVKGNKTLGQIYYTNSTYLSNSAPLTPEERVYKEGLFHPLIEAGALTHIWLGENKPDPKSISNFVIKTFNKTQNAQIAFSPEFTICDSCGKTDRGLHDRCRYCNSSSVDGITRITGYFSKISSWNNGKKGELADRRRHNIL